MLFGDEYKEIIANMDPAQIRPHILEQLERVRRTSAAAHRAMQVASALEIEEEYQLRAVIILLADVLTECQRDRLAIMDRQIPPNVIIEDAERKS